MFPVSQRMKESFINLLVNYRQVIVKTLKSLKGRVYILFMRSVHKNQMEHLINIRKEEVLNKFYGKIEL